MLDVGWGELLLLAVVALLIFGPDKLPKAAADAGRLVRRLREMAQSAQKDLGGTGVDIEGIKNDLRSVADLHPKRIISSALAEPTFDTKPAASAEKSAPIADAGPAGASDAGTAGAPAADGVPGPKPTSARLDPDAT
ncbi:MAG: Sec-independent protein translocase protein TatB [Candidatus Nanopelagicales bacterium]